MIGVLVVVLATSLVITHLTLTRSAESNVRDRLTSAAHQVASTIAPTIVDRTTQLGRVVRDPRITGALAAATTPGADTSLAYAAARAALETLRTRSDSLFPTELWTADGRRVVTLGPATSPERAAGDSLPHPGLGPFTPKDSVRFGRMYAQAGRIYYWSAAPVMERGQRIGAVVQQKRVGGPRSAPQMLRELIGEDVTMYTRNASDGLWTTSPGIVSPTPTRRDSTVRRPLDLWPDGRYAIFGEAAVRGAPWYVVLETPLASVHARARETVVRIALLSIFLTALGALVSWTISRRVTRPLRELTTAAEGIARGDYSRQVTPGGADELVRLASSFNEMAREVDASHQELEQQVEEAQSAAEALEIANLHLQETTVAAEEAREEAIRARAEAERANQAKSDFLAVMSHELRTPLNAIAGYTQILAMGVHGPVNDAQRDALERIARSETHLLRLITDVLNFAKIDAGQMEFAIADVPLDETLAEVETLVAPQLQAKGLRYTYERCDPMLTVRADREKLLQVVLNLLSNAIKFTARGGSVRVSCATTERGVRIMVRDTGCGIPPKRMASIFEPFVQGDRALHRPHEGIGLGLAISRDLARGMGGDISAESVEGEGSTFTVVLTRGPAGAALAGKLPRSDRGGAATPV